jgi:uncharacterized protein with von Willebrand factor type A (vWA) domain
LSMRSNLESNVIAFCRRLRAEGVSVNQANTLTAIAALEQTDLLTEEHFYFALRSVLCFSQEDYRRFDRVYRGFWELPSEHAGKEQRVEPNKDDKANFSEKPDMTEADQTGPGMSGAHSVDDGEVDDDLQQKLPTDTQIHRMASYSASEQLQHNQITFGKVSSNNELVRDWSSLFELLHKSMARDSLRSGQSKIDLKRTIRKNLQFGGDEWFKLYRQGESRQNKQQLVTFADISGSMEQEFIAYLPLIYQLHKYTRSSQLYMFTTNMFKVDHHFLQSTDKMVEALNKQLKLAARGTNLGQSIAQFRKNHGHQLSPFLTTFFLFTDGWDRGDMGLLKEQISRLRKQVYQIIWLNPMLGRDGYTPSTQAIEIVKPFISHMISAEDFTSMKQGG